MFSFHTFCFESYDFTCQKKNVDKTEVLILNGEQRNSKKKNTIK